MDIESEDRNLYRINIEVRVNERRYQYLRVALARRGFRIGREDAPLNATSGYREFSLLVDSNERDFVLGCLVDSNNRARGSYNGSNPRKIKGPPISFSCNIAKR